MKQVCYIFDKKRFMLQRFLIDFWEENEEKSDIGVCEYPFFLTFEKIFQWVTSLKK